MSQSDHPPAVLRWSGWTDRGQFRPNNEDAFLGVCFDAREMQLLGKIGQAPARKMDFAFAVSDGMGGAKAGEYASHITTEKIKQLLPPSYRLTDAGLEAQFRLILKELFEQIHQELVYQGGSYQECSGMEATLSLCWFTPHRLYFGHIGDSRIYHLPAHEKRIKQLSEDDTHVGWMLRQGQINEREARSHPRRHVLQKALGGGNQFVDPQSDALRYEKGDIFLLCTDGLVEGLYDHDLTEHLRTTQTTGGEAVPARRLVEASLACGTRDNVTALVVEVI